MFFVLFQVIILTLLAFLQNRRQPNKCGYHKPSLVVLVLLLRFKRFVPNVRASFSLKSQTLENMLHGLGVIRRGHGVHGVHGEHGEHGQAQGM